MASDQEILEILLRSKSDAQGFKDFVNADAEARSKILDGLKKQQEGYQKTGESHKKSSDEITRTMQGLARAQEAAFREDDRRAKAGQRLREESIAVVQREAAAIKRASDEATRAGQQMARAHESALKDQAKQLNATASEWSKFGNQIKAGLGLGAGLGIGVAAANAFVAALRGIPVALRESGRWAENLQNVNTTLGFGIQRLQVYQQLAKETGVSFSAITGGAEKLGQKVAEGDQALVRLGLDLDHLRESQPGEIFTEVAEKIASLGTQHERLAATIAVFGRGAANDYLPFIEKLRDADTMARLLSNTLDDEQVAALANMDNQLDKVNTAWETFQRRQSAILAETPGFVTGTDAMAFGIERLSRAASGPWMQRYMDFVMFVAKWSPGGMLGTFIADQEVASPWGPGRDIELPSDGGRYKAKGDEARLGKEIEEGERVLRKSAEMWERHRRDAVESAKVIRDFQMSVWKDSHKAMNDYFDDMLRRSRQPELTGAWMGVARHNAQGAYTLGNKPATERDAFGLPELDKWIDPAKGFWTGYQDVVDGIADEMAQKNQVRAKSFETDWSQVLGNVAHLFQIMGVSSDSALSKTVGGLLGGLSAGQQLRDLAARQGGEISMGQFGAGALQAGMGAYGSGSMLGGAASGAAFGSTFGPWGAAIGGVAGGVLGLLGKGAKEKRELEELRKGLVDVYGSMDKVRSLGAAVGVSMSAAFSDKNPKAAKAAIEALQKALEKTKTEIADWERGVVSAQARALLKADPNDPDAKAFIKEQAALSVAGLRAFGTVKDGKQTGGIAVTNAEDMRAQATIASLVFWDTFKTEGLLAAASAFQPIAESLQASLAKIGGDEATAAILGPIQQLVDLGTTNEAFKAATEGAQGLSETLTGLANRDVPMTTAQYQAFEQQAKSAYEQAKAGALEAGLSQEQAVNAAIMAAAPLLQALVQSGQAYGMTLGEDTQAMLDMAQASGIAFKTDSTDRLIASINALTTAMGGIPPTFEAIGTSATRAGDEGARAASTTAVAFAEIPASAGAASASIREFGGATGETFAALVEGATTSTEQVVGLAIESVTASGAQMAQVAGVVTGSMVDAAGFATSELANKFIEATGTIEEEFVSAQNVMVLGFTETLPKSVQEYMRWLDNIPVDVYTTAHFNAPDPEEGGNHHAAGVTNKLYPARRGGHWINVSEAGRGEYVTVTHSPVTMATAGGGLVRSKRVPRGVTHAEEGYGDNVFDAIQVGEGGALAAQAITGEGVGSLGEVASRIEQAIANIPAMIAEAIAESNAGPAPTVHLKVEQHIGRLSANRPEEIDAMKVGLAREIQAGTSAINRALERYYSKQLGRR